MSVINQFLTLLCFSLTQFLLTLENIFMHGAEQLLMVERASPHILLTVRCPLPCLGAIQIRGPHRRMRGTEKYLNFAVKQHRFFKQRKAEGVKKSQVFCGRPIRMVPYRRRAESVVP